MSDSTPVPPYEMKSPGSDHVPESAAPSSAPRARSRLRWSLVPVLLGLVASVVVALSMRLPWAMQGSQPRYYGFEMGITAHLLGPASNLP